MQGLVAWLAVSTWVFVGNALRGLHFLSRCCRHWLLFECHVPSHLRCHQLWGTQIVQVPIRKTKSIAIEHFVSIYSNIWISRQLKFEKIHLRIGDRMRGRLFYLILLGSVARMLTQGVWAWEMPAEWPQMQDQLKLTCKLLWANTSLSQK